jgi:hypothetical protein
MFLATDIFEYNNSLCVVVFVVALQNKMQPVAQPQCLDEENYSRGLQHPKT